MKGTPEKNTCLDYTRKTGLRASAIGLRKDLSINDVCGWPKPESRKPGSRKPMLPNVAIAAGPFASARCAVEIGNQSFQICDE
jgi:hypothetical protein